MTEPIRTPDQITDQEIARLTWHLRMKDDPIGDIVGALSPRTAFDFLRDDYAGLSERPEYQAWGHDTEEVAQLRERIAVQLEAYRSYTVPVVLTSRVGRELIAGLARVLWRGVPSWDRVAAILDTEPHLRDLAVTLGYPDTLGLDEIVPAATAAWFEIAAEASQ